MRLFAPAVTCVAQLAVIATALMGASPAVAQEEAPARAEIVTDTVYVYRPLSAFNLYLYQGAMGTPSALAVDVKNREVWVADTTRDLLAVFAANGVSLFAFGSEELLKQPQHIVVSASGELLVVEGKGRSVRRFSYRGEYRGELPLDRFPTEASIGAIACDADGNLYVAENRSGQIFVYNASGRLRFQFGSRGTGEGQFLSVTGIAIAPDGGIFVADQQGVPVQSFDNQGNYLTGWGKHEMGRENFALPSGIAVNSKGLVIVADELRHDLKSYDAQGHVVQMWGGQGTDLGALSFPTAIAVGVDDRLYVAERGNRRVQVFDLVQGKRAPSRPRGE